MSVSYTNLYALLEQLTPLPIDCGRLCSRICCKGGDENTPAGMVLFPGEQQRLSQVNFGHILPLEGQAGWLFVCQGRCDRSLRPLACRLFPLFPYLRPSGRISAVYDPRGFRLCPLIQQNRQIRLTPAFVRAVRQVGRALAQTPEGRAYLHTHSREIDEFNQFLRLDQQRSPIQRRRKG